MPLLPKACASEMKTTWPNFHHRYSGFTLLIVPDKDLYGKYPDRFNESMTMDEKIDALYELAAEKYSGADAEAIFGLNQTVPGSDKTYTGTKVH